MNLERYLAPVYSGAPFVLFGPAHWIALAVTAACGLGLFWIRQSWSAPARQVFRWGLACWLTAWELAVHAWFAWAGTWSVQTMLPLHLCSISGWLSVIMLLTGNYRAYEVAFFLGLGGATQALITPEVGSYGFPHFRALQSFGKHGGIVLAALYMTFVEGYRPTASSLKRVIFSMTLYVPAVFLLNLALGSNYLYLAEKPEFPTLIGFLAPWPWYIPELALIAIAVACTLYLPFWIATRRGQARLG